MSAPPLPRGVLLAYAAPAVIGSILSLTLQTFAAPFYATEVGLGLATVGLIVGAVRIFDLAFDPLFGFASDRLQTRWGRRRQWFVITGPVLMVVVYLFFNPPAHPAPVYFAVLLTLIYMGWSVVTISHMALGMELTSDYRQRNRVSAVREFGVVAGILAALGVSAILETFFSADQRTKSAAMGWVLIALVPVTAAVLCRFVPEARQAPAARADWRGAWRMVFASSPLRRIMLVDLLLTLATSTRAGLYLFLTDRVFHIGGHSSALLLVQFITGFLGIELWTQLAHRFSRHRTLAFSALLTAALSPAVLFLPHGPEAFWPLLVLNSIGGLSFGAGAVLLRSLLGDVVDQDSAASGQRRMGGFFSFMIMVQKLGQALAVTLTYPVLAAVGFHPKGANAPEAQDGLLLIFVVMPMLLSLLAAALMWRFPQVGETSRAAPATHTQPIPLGEQA